MRVAIHQPNFLPWLGYFQKILRADRFIFLDDAALVRTGGSYVNRVRLPLGGRPAWRTVPLRRPGGGAPLIRDARIDDRIPWRRRFLATLRALYGRSPHFDEVYAALTPFIDNGEPGIAALNTAAVRFIAGRLGAPPDRFLVSSELRVGASGTERLVRLVRAAGGDVYLCGRGSRNYQDDAAFAAAGIAVERRTDPPPAYPAFAPCDPPGGLSIVDALMSRGFDGTADLLAGSR